MDELTYQCPQCHTELHARVVGVGDAVTISLFDLCPCFPFSVNTPPIPLFMAAREAYDLIRPHLTLVK